NFYEDYFDFIPVTEKDGFVVLEHRDNPAMRISVFDAGHRCVTSIPSTQGLILNIAVGDAKAAYDHLYMEGLTMYKEYGRDIHGNNHFVATDPNGVLINVVEQRKE